MLDYHIILLLIIILIFWRAVAIRKRADTKFNYSELPLADYKSNDGDTRTIENPKDKDILPALEKLIQSGDGTVIFSLSDEEWIQILLLSKEDKSFSVCYGRDPEKLHFSNSPKSLKVIEDLIKDSIKGRWSWVDRYNDWVHDGV